MSDPRARIMDEMAKLMTGAAGMAEGVRREIDTVVRHQLERILDDLDLVRRDEFEVLADRVARLEKENVELKARIDPQTWTSGGNN